jgi:plastocyanin
MKKTLLILSIVNCVAWFASAGSITGSVCAEGKRPAELPGADGKYDSRKFKFAERINYEELRGFVVYIEGEVGEKPTPPAKPLVVDTHRIAQKGAAFSPHVLPVVAGTTVEWPNNDDIFHNVFSMSDVKPFDLDLYKGNPPDKRVTFDKPGQVDVFCSIHANMHCVVLVLQNPYYAVAAGDGRYAITNIPPGAYKLKAWHERMPAQVKEITVPEQGELKVNFVLGITNLPKY